MITFRHCAALREIALPEGLTTVDDNAFSQSGLVRLKVPASVVRLGNRAFIDCTWLTEVTFAENSMLKKICEHCFERTGMPHITLPDGLETVETGAFFRCPNLKVIYTNGDPAMCDGAFVDSQVAVRPKSDARLGDALVLDLRAQRDVALPEAEQIGPETFRRSEIEKARIPASVVVIGESAFRECARLKTVAFAPNARLERICADAFAESALESFTAPASLRAISRRAFSGCVNLRFAALNESLEALESGVFQGCVALERAKLSEGLEEVAECAFRGAGLKTVEVPNSVLSLKSNAFAECANLKSVAFRPGAVLSEIGSGCFAGSGLTRVVFPAGIRKIGSFAFEGCSRLREVVLNDGIEEIGDSAFKGTAVRQIRLPASLRVLDGAFRYCESLRAVELASGLRVIGEGCFSSSGLRKIMIPASVEEIGTNAFNGCGKLWKVVFAAGSELRNVGTQAFRGTRVSPKMEFPAGVAVADDAFWVSVKI